MEFLEQIEKLQKKPETTKVKIMIATVFIVMTVIILIWIQTTRRGFSEKKTDSDDELNKIAEPLKLLGNAAGDAFKNLKDRFQKLKP